MAIAFPWDFLVNVGSVTHVAEGHVLFAPGDCPKSVPFILEGGVRVYCINSHGGELTLYHAKRGDVCCLSALTALAQAPFNAWAVAEGPLSVLWVASGDLRNAMQGKPALAEYLFHSFYDRALGLLKLLSDLAFERFDRRLAVFLLSHASSLEEYPDGLEITHAQIASELGVARETVSRSLKSFERAHGLSLRRGHVVLRKDSLPFLERVRGEVATLGPDAVIVNGG